MNRISLPGNLRTKKILLGILVVISICVLFKVSADNRKLKIEQERVKEEQRIEEERIKSHEEKIKEELREKEDYLYNEAYGDFFNNDYKNAIDKANELIEDFPESYKGYNIRGIAKAFNGNFQEGMDDINRSLELSPNYGYARFNKALNYELYNKLDEALTWYDKALEVEDYIWSHYGKASIYGRRGDVDNTVINLKKAIDTAKKTGDDQAVKDDAKTEHDFDPVRGNSEFEELINN